MTIPLRGGGDAISDCRLANRLQERLQAADGITFAATAGGMGRKGPEAAK